MLQRFIVIAALVAGGLSAETASAQLASIRGVVTEAGSGRPLPGASVVLQETGAGRQGIITDAGGSYLFTRLRPGDYVLQVSFVGFEAHVDSLAVGFDEVIVLNVAMQEQTETLQEVVVEEERAGQTRSTAGLETIRPSALARVPMPDVSYDLAGYLLTLPGFVSTGDRGGQLFVRGGTSTQNLVLVDGIPVFQPFHILGFYSAFPADIISYADVYAGGFGARYGGRISSVVDITTTNGNKTSPEGTVSLAPFVSGVQFSLPVEEGKVSLVGSARQSLVEWVGPKILGEDLPYRFGDRFLKLHAFLNQTSSLSVTGIRTFDQGDLGFSDQERPSSWRNDAFGVRYTFIPETNAVMSQFAMHYSRLESRYQPAPLVEQRADIDAYTMEILIAYLMGKSRVHVAVFGNLNRFKYDLGPRSREVRGGITSGGGYIDAQLEVTPSFRFEPGIRYEVFSRGLRGSIAPRVRLMWLPLGPGSRQQWSFAFGRYHQQIVGLNNEQDVSDVFTIWAPSPGNEPVPQAQHLILGVQQRVNRWLELSVEGYYKDMDNLAFPVFDDGAGGLTGFSQVEGTAQGVDFRAQVNRRHLYASVAYTLARVEYTWSEDTRPVAPGVTLPPLPSGSFNPPHDRRHQVNASLQVTSGATRLSTRWQMGSGLPFTQIQGFFQDIVVDPGSPRGYLDQIGPPIVARGPDLAARLPAYHRLDVSLERDFTSRRAVTTVQAGVINLYDRANIFQYNFFSGERLNQLPLVPSVGVAVRFQ